MQTAGERAAERYRLLAVGLGDQLGRRYGWMSAVARRLGVDVSYLKKIVDGKRTSIGFDTVELAVQGVPIQRAYFTGEWPPGREQDWRDFVLVGPTESPPPDPWQIARELAQRFVAAARLGRPDAAAAHKIAEAVRGDGVVRAAAKVAAAARDQDAIEGGYELAAMLLTDDHAAVSDLPVQVVKVRSVPGKFVTYPGRVLPLGYRRASRSDAGEHVVDYLGVRLVAEGEAVVALSPWIQQSLLEGALARVDE